MNYPSTWKKIKFGDIAKRKSVRIDNPQESEYKRYVGLEHLDSGELVVKRWGSAKDVTSNMQIFNKNDILFARRNTYLRRVSVAFFDGVCSGDIIVIEPILDHIIEGFLPIYMQFEEFENKVVAWSAGAFSKRIKWKQLSDFDIWIPSKEEQQKIVDIIWCIHDNQERAEKLIQVTEKLKKGFLEEILTKGIGHKKFKNSKLGDIPEEWEIKKVEDVLSFEYGQGLPEKKRVSGKFPVIGSNGIVGYHDSYIVESPAIIVGRKGASGEVILCNQNCWPIDTTYFIKLHNCMDILFSYYLLKSLKLIELSQKGAVPGLNRNDVYEMLVLIAPKQEQKQISIMINKFDNLKIDFELHLEKIKQLKKKLTNEFLSGNLLILKEVLN